MSRKNYPQRTLREKDVEASPFKQFERWYADAVNGAILVPNSMALATATRAGEPSLRTVLMKDFDERGFVFYTNYRSRKGLELRRNPHGALLFHWAELERQVRVRGIITKISREESAAYFHSRPRDSRLNTWASHQSRPLKNRQELDDRFTGFKKQYAGLDIPLPAYWGGYRLVPEQFEFWQGRPHRMHDRLQYTLKNERWKIVRLAP